MRYLLTRSVREQEPIRLSQEQLEVVAHQRGRLKVLAGPGTGKSATLVECIADRIIHRSVDPASMLVLTFSRGAAADLSRRIAARIDVTTREPLVRTLHSYAYALLRGTAQKGGVPPPTLLPASQADLVVREILQGHADDGGRYWPPELHAALGVPSFARELRELMLRVAERRIEPRKIAEWGRRRQRPEWVAVAHFIDEYRDIAELRQGTTRRGAKLDQAELMVAALECLQDPAILAAQRRRVRRVFVDEYQDVDPAQAALLELLAQGADEVVVVGDPDQAIYSFRGAVAGAMDRFDADTTVSLTVSHRLPPDVVSATRRVAAGIPGPRTHRELTSAVGADIAAGRHHDHPRQDAHRQTQTRTPALEIRLLRTTAQEAAFVADQFRRAHLTDGVPWGQMVVILRAPSHSGDVFRRALASVGVPTNDTAVRPLASEPLVAALLTVLRAGINPETLTGAAAVALLGSPLARMDPVSIRRLRRAVRRTAAADGSSTSTEIIAKILLGQRTVPLELPPDLARGLTHLARLIALATAGAADPIAEEVLWRVWQAADIVGELLAASERGGPDGMRADAHLDAAVELFDRAARLAEELPLPGIGGLLGLLADEHIHGAVPTASAEESVTITSAHGSKGLEWDVVAVAGVQEDTWPDLRPRRSLLRYDELIDVATGIEPGLPQASQLADERRLFYVATTRARRRLIVTAVESAQESPSRFIDDIAGPDGAHRGWPEIDGGQPRRLLHLPALVAELRTVVCDPARADSTQSPTPPSDQIHREAAEVLSVLAESKVRGASPDDWYGLAPVSTDAPVTSVDVAVTLSPSQVESLQQCPLRTALERHGGRPDPGQAQLLGIAIHALAQGMALGATSGDIDQAVDEFLATQEELPPWERARLARRMNKMREALEAWMTTTAQHRTLIGAELPVDVTIPAETRTGLPDEPMRAAPDGDFTGPDYAIRLRGRIDWLARDEDGRVVITDFKTGSTKPTVAEARTHPQMATYQLALALGGLADTFDGDIPELGGAELVYLASGRPELRVQPRQESADRSQWLTELRHLADEAIGPQFTARQGSYCDRCPVRASCPLQPEGRQVTA